MLRFRGEKAQKLGDLLPLLRGIVRDHTADVGREIARAAGALANARGNASPLVFVGRGSVFETIHREPPFRTPRTSRERFIAVS